MEEISNNKEVSFFKKHVFKFLNIVGLIADGISIFGLIHSSKENNFETPFFVSLNILILSVTLTIIGWIIYGKIASLLKNRTQAIENLDNVANQLHCKMIHKIRDAYHGYANNIPISRIRTILLELIKDYSIVLSNLLGKKINVCIKRVVPKQNDNDMINWSVKTEVRYCPKFYQKRKEKDNELIPIKGNTDFEDIAKGKSFFASGNLPDLQAKGKYHNTNPTYGIYYKSAMSLPIRCVIHSDDIGTDDKFHIIGFLCLDSLEVSPEWEREDNFIFSMTALFADSLYILMRESIEYTNRVKPQVIEENPNHLKEIKNNIERGEPICH